MVVSMLANHNQFAMLKVVDSFSSWFYVTVVYASPIRSVRDSLSDILHRQDSKLNDPWIIGGDFNFILQFFGERKCDSMRQDEIYPKLKA